MGLMEAGVLGGDFFALRILRDLRFIPSGSLTTDKHGGTRMGKRGLNRRSRRTRRWDEEPSICSSGDVRRKLNMHGRMIWEIGTAEDAETADGKGEPRITWRARMGEKKLNHPLR